MQKIKLNIEAVLDIARKCGVSVKSRERMTTALEDLCSNGREWDLKTARVSKALGEISPQSAPYLPHATELQGRLLLGQWKYVGDELEWLADQCEAAPSPRHDPPFDGRGEQPDPQLFTRADALRHFARIFKATPESAGAQTSPHSHTLSYKCHQATNILACGHHDCGVREGCWASRGWCQTREEESEQKAQWEKQRTEAKLRWDAEEDRPAPTALEMAGTIRQHAHDTSQYEFHSQMKAIEAELSRAREVRCALETAISENSQIKAHCGTLAKQIEELQLAASTESLTCVEIHADYYEVAQ